MCSWWDSNRASVTNPLIKYWAGIRDVLYATGKHGKAIWHEERALLGWGKGAKRKRQKGGRSQTQCPHFPFPNWEWPSNVELLRHTYWKSQGWQFILCFPKGGLGGRPPLWGPAFTGHQVTLASEQQKGSGPERCLGSQCQSPQSSENQKCFS